MRRQLFLLFTIGFMLFTNSIFAQKRYGLIIGSNYKGNKAGISELNLCEADATYIRDQIKKVGKFEDIKILLGKDVVKTRIEQEIRDLGKRASGDDTVMLFFAGHGFYQRDANAPNGMKNYIVCYDRPHLSDDELNEYMKSITSQKTVFVFDCCFSGGIAKKGKKTRGSADVPIPEGSNGTVKQNSEDFYFQDKAILSSSDDNQTSIELGGNINHGLFTYCFGKAMEDGDLNGDKVVTALEAFFKAKDQVVKMAAEVDHKQTPQVSGDASGIMLAGEKQPVTPPPAQDPPVVDNPKPQPANDPVKPNPVKPPVSDQEPPVVNTGKTGTVLIRTSIIVDRKYGLTSLPPEQMIKAKKDRKGDRNVKVLIDGNEYPFTLTKVKSDYFGAMQKENQLIQGEVYNITVNGVPTGVHKLEVFADEYPKQELSFAVLSEKSNDVELIASMSGFGAIMGNVFYKTLDNPINKQPIYMPTVKAVNGLQKTYTDKNGNFWFTNLIPGDYEIKASFAEDLALNNSMLSVKEGEINKVQVILNVKLKGTQSKY